MGRLFFKIAILLIFFVFFKCQKDEVEDQSEPIEVSFEVIDPSETGASDGSVSTEVNGGSPPYSFSWSNGVTTKDMEGVTAGSYILTIIDSRDQSLTDTVHLVDVVTDVDGNVYTIKKIGNQTWMRQNLRVTHDPDSGGIISYVYNDDTSNVSIYGRLYTWDVAMNGSDKEGAQGICPCGWHIPTDEEFMILEMHLGMNRAQAEVENGWRGSPVGDKLKAGGESGYDAQMSGGYLFGRYYALGQSEYMWSSTEYTLDTSKAWRRCLAAYKSTVGRYNTYNKNYRLSVRCVKDD